MARNQKPEKAPSASAWWRWSNVLHLGLNIALPFAMLALVRSNLESLAILLVVASKWRVFTVKPRHLIANIRANLTDFFVKLGTVIFIIDAESAIVQLAWTLWYVVWLTIIKPRTGKAWMGVQALIGQAIGLSAVFQFSESIDPWLLLTLVWVVAYASARHFITNYNEPWAGVITHLWALFSVQLAWILFKWLLLFGIVPQIVLILTAIGYLLASLYDASYQEKLETSFIRQQVFMTGLIIALVIFASDWQGQI